MDTCVQSAYSHEWTNKIKCEEIRNQKKEAKNATVSFPKDGLWKWKWGKIMKKNGDY